ncbi:MAG: hypothetical protein NVS4B2_19600 [Chloroflexota bacterium]
MTRGGRPQVAATPQEVPDRATPITDEGGCPQVTAHINDRYLAASYGYPPEITKEANKPGGKVGPDPEPVTPEDLMLAIAGDDKTHVEMCPAGGDKYRTYPGRVTADLIREHMAGTKTIGTTLRHAGHMTRILKWEVDDASVAEKLRTAATKLACAGASPLLEDSPSVHHPGGLHLSLIFDALVDAGAAFATAEKWAPELRGIHERWPCRKRVRLPGGYYQRPEAEGWCNVWKPGGLHLHGAQAFELLVQSQTPAAWVTESPPAPPPSRPQSTCTHDGPFYTTGDPIYESGDPGRNVELTRRAGGMVGRGASGAQLEALVSEMNQNCCRPPLPESEVREIARSVEATHRRNHGPGL